ncbi:pyruvate, water dikinase regulatory protein [Rickettsiales endosymbiont of Stachyamoeba lipophora]|uniref:pyruvate, water dikinase regulatory protein n=1 Tax=Rickettsiales endosymbiont of Stachyamoeba lipophora TaxID=2486578 RepID=UPI000F64E57B|nr:pyruvate, water dikinase regulatory protein [Rickettsiales endosymbiont of Stachyamoeba lipophora]AZL15604.1 kinase/pyrophosphorylase [Rickettsiales endosymbiont of Stachyamoeba lipophora]
MEALKKVNLYLISDSTGNTLRVMSKSVTDRFSGVKFKITGYSFIRNIRQIDQIIENISKRPGIVMYTIIDDEVRNYLKTECDKIGVEYIAALTHVIFNLAKFLDIDHTSLSHRKLELDEDYYQKIEAIKFTLNHDDGQNYKNLDKADIIIVGVSRSSKSPTSVYLANRGFKAANVPYTIDSPILEHLKLLKNPFIVGLTVLPERLIDVRKNRLLTLKDKNQNSYTDIEEVREEVMKAKKFFQQNDWPIIDVTQRSVEEIASKIIQLYENKEI